ncbi:CRISPR system precrRNA processing endoribonuclease RAMP protein Cas6 [Pelovirga terrestris]|uniref:CRISPR system precrRNA processing endoribonuclease RAMP protein Cas6 n=1 Tax=Pelovirga terrestris TaxID=2771352 RepID=A0A8J6UH53_9BACT|nr:CRISPR system precrRNA processing endoribonuclease RAMP protein Cas6 [Pelovirga terrestris]MBD1400933.1 CRISPR system precrRNA processing endoribonuclease RAMP protein Cas6 [Pelovirga terrestris]
MPLSVSPPPWLDRLDCAQLTFELTLLEEVDLPAQALLQLRRELSSVLADLKEQQGVQIADLVSSLLFPAPAIDPVIRRQVQKPASAVILSPPAVTSGVFAIGHRFKLPTLFVGDGVVGIEAFTLLLQVLGQRGVHKGQGRFNLSLDESAPSIVPLSWLLLQQPLLYNHVKLEIVTPMRLINKGKPLFKFDVNCFFSAVQRRAINLACAHGLGVNDNDDELNDLAATIVCCDNALHWQDWRILEQGRKGQGIGGLTGTLTLSGDALAELWWLLELGALLQVGKGASYGFGRFHLLQYA